MLGGEAGLGVERGPGIGGCVVGFFHAVDERPALQGPFAQVLLDARVGLHHLDGHVELQFHVGPFAALAGDAEVAFAGLFGEFAAVDGGAVGLAPSGNAHAEVAREGLVRGDAEAHFALPGIEGGEGEFHGGAVELHLGFVADEEVHPQGVVGDSIDVIADGGQEARNLARAAGAAVPCLAVMVAVRLEGIDIKEAVAAE